jgi:glucose/mannose-6-phosphate isomerase
MNSIDDPAVIAQRDPQDALGVALREWQQFHYDFGVTLDVTQGVQHVVMSGMGGSALPGVMIPVWPGVAVPFEVSRGYRIPSYVGPKTLFVASSYSGNTEETLEAFDTALQTGATIVVIAAGGQLAERARQHSLPLYTIPGGVQPRMCAFYFMRAIADILTQYGLASADDSVLNGVGEWLGEQARQWGSEVPVEQNLAKQIARDLCGKTAIIYSGPLMAPAANKWKICINENAKNLAWWGQYSEFNHNEFIGWSSHPVEKPFGVVEIRSSLEHPRMARRFEVSEQLLSGLRPSPIVVEPHGDTVLEHMVWSICLGDVVSVYLALLNGVNPTPVALVERLKKELG